MEWRSCWLYPPPRDGSWFMAVHKDCSGAVFFAFRDGEWYDAGGANNFYHHPDGLLCDFDYWAPLPPWMLPWLDAQGLKELRNA